MSEINRFLNNYGATSNNHVASFQEFEGEILSNSEREERNQINEQEAKVEFPYGNTRNQDFDDDEDEEENSDLDDVYLLGSKRKGKKSSSKFVGYRKSFLNKIQFRFPSSFRSKRLNNQKLENINTKRSDSVMHNESTENYNEEQLEKPKEHTPNVFSRFLMTINEKIFPSRFVLNNNLDENKKKFSKVKNSFNSMKKYLKHLKIIILTVYCLSCIILFMINNDEEENWYQSVVSSSSSYTFSYDMIDSETIINTDSQYLKCILHGPFRNENRKVANIDIDSISFLKVNIFENDHYHNVSNSSKPIPTILSSWTINLVDGPDAKTYTQLSFTENIFVLGKKYQIHDVKFQFTTTSVQPLSINFDCKQLSQRTSSKSTYAILLLLFVYGLIMFDLIHRTLAAALGALGGLAVLSVVNMNRPTLITIVSWIEWETLLLLTGMMIIVAIFCETGFFDLVAVKIFRYVGNRIWIMITCLCLLAAVLSAFLDNVTTILLLAPISIKLSEVLNLDPRHLLIAQVIFSNIGGASTAIGDPPNVIITANSVIRDNGVDFTNFTVHMLVGSIFVYIVSFVHFRFLYSNVAKFKSQNSSEINELNKEIIIWKRSFKNITPVTKEEIVVKTLLKEKVSQLQYLRSKRISEIKQVNQTSLREKTDDLVQNYKITSFPLLIKCSIVFFFTLLLFFIHPFLPIHLTIGWISILSAIVLITLTSTTVQHSTNQHSESTSFNGIDLEAIIHKIEWSTLLFFACLFIFMRSIEELGLLHDIGDIVSNIIKSVDNEDERLVVAITLIMITSALVSSIIDNIPFTTAMIPIIIQLNETLGIPLTALTYA